MDNKKSGIRLRHLEQNHQADNKRELSPNTINRKKIFEKTHIQKFHEKLVSDDKRVNQNIPVKDIQNDEEYQSLIESLKKKTMEVELRDQTIRYLNKEIDDLKKQLRLKDKEISNLTNNIDRLERVSKEKAQLKPQQTQFGKDQINNYQRFDRISSIARPVNEEISLMNLNFKSADLKKEQPQILSPFMALKDVKKQNGSAFSSQMTVKQPTSYNPVKTAHDYSISSSFDQQYSNTANGFYKKPKDNNFSQQQKSFDQKNSSYSMIDKNMQKFNIFGQKQQKPMSKNKLEIEDSREFKFEDFDPNGYDFNKEESF